MDKPVPGAGRLFGDALETWTHRSTLFWPIAAGIAAALGGFQYAVDAGWLGSRNQSYSSAAVGFTYAYVLDHFIKHLLFPDWKERSAKLTKQKSKAAHMNGRFVGFCLAYGFVVSVLSIIVLLFFLNDALVKSGQLPLIMIVIVGFIQPPLMAVVAILFAGYLLYLPGKSSGADLSLVEAWTLGLPIRGILIRLALLCVLFTVVSHGVVIGVSVLRLPDAPWTNALVRVAVTLIDLVVVFVLAHGLSRLFVHAANWTPGPLPVAEVQRVA